MISTVDLTLKRDFSKNNDNEFFNSIARHIMFTRIGKTKLLPWRNQVRHIESDADLSINHGGLYRESDYDNSYCLIVGTKKDREEFKFKQLIYGDVCERCGNKLQEIPWDKEYGFCKRCYNDLKTEKEIYDERKCWIYLKEKDNENKVSWRGK